MESMITVVVYSASGLLCLAVAAFLAFTVYTYYHGKKYSHIPSPKKSKYVADQLMRNNLLSSHFLQLLFGTLTGRYSHEKRIGK